MGFVEAIKSCFSQYVTFSGRASRSEYWYFNLFLFLMNVTLTIATGLIGDKLGSLLSGLFTLATLLPSISAGVRRMHDLGKSGWAIWINLIPLVGWIIYLVWLCTKGTDGDNRFGPDPLA